MEKRVLGFEAILTKIFGLRPLIMFQVGETIFHLLLQIIKSPSSFCVRKTENDYYYAECAYGKHKMIFHTQILCVETTKVFCIRRLVGLGVQRITYWVQRIKC
jgi:hypothetical protein